MTRAQPDNKARCPCCVGAKPRVQARGVSYGESEGGGDGPAAAAIEPRPRNCRDPAFWKGRTREQLRLVVEQGKPGTLMAPFEGALSPAEIDDVVAYLQSFRPAGS